MKKHLLTLFVLTQTASTQWVHTNGPYGGYVEAFAVSPASGEMSGTNIFCGIANAGIFRSTNNGTTWTCVNNGITGINPYWVNISLAASATNIFASMRMDKFTYGVFHSTNSGDTWIDVPASSPVHSMKGACFLNDTNIIVWTSDHGIFRSTDNGITWSAINDGLPKFPGAPEFYDIVSAFAVSRASGGTNFFAGTGSGVFLSTNNGTSWIAANTPFSSFSNMTNVGMNLFAGTDSGGVFLSPDKGISWNAVNNGLPKDLSDSSRYVSVSNLAVTIASGGSGDTNMFALTQGGLFLTTNHGASWMAANSTGLPANISFTTITAFDGNVFAGTDGMGVYLSTNNGTSWNAAATGLDVLSIVSLSASGTNLFAGTARILSGGLSDGPGSVYSTGVFLSTNDGTSWTTIGLTNTQSERLIVNDIVISPASGGTGGTNMIAGTDGCGVFLSTDNGTSWSQVDSGLTTLNVVSLVVVEENIFAGTWDGVFRSTNNGKNWTHVGLGGGAQATYLVVSPNGTGGMNLFAESFDQGVFLSTNNGGSWTAVNTGLPSLTMSVLTCIGTNLFAGIPDYGIFLSTNNGTNWTAANNGLTDKWIVSLGVGGTNIFVRTWSDGIFLSTNNGTNWSAIQLPFNNFSRMITKGDDLFVGTTGGVWRRPLSEMFTSVERFSAEVPTHFGLEQNYPNPFNPATTIRYSLSPAPSPNGRGDEVRVKLTIHDILGREVATLVNEEQSAGWKEVQWDATRFSSGVYFYILRAGEHRDTKRMILIK